MFSLTNITYIASLHSFRVKKTFWCNKRIKMATFLTDWMKIGINHNSKQGQLKLKIFLENLKFNFKMVLVSKILYLLSIQFFQLYEKRFIFGFRKCTLVDAIFRAGNMQVKQFAVKKIVTHRKSFRLFHYRIY